MSSEEFHLQKSSCGRKSCLARRYTGSGAGELDSGLLCGGRLCKTTNAVSDGSTMATAGRDVVTVEEAAGLNQALVSQ